MRESTKVENSKTTNRSNSANKNNLNKSKNSSSCGPCGACRSLSSPRLSSESTSSVYLMLRAIGKESCVVSFMQKNHGNSFTTSVLSRPSAVGGQGTAISYKPLAISRKCSCGGSCQNCKGEEEAERVSTSIMKMSSPLISYKPSADYDEQAQISEIMSNKGLGHGLDDNTSSFMGDRFGYDFSHVRLHNDNYAARKSNELNAEAFTIGRDVFFNAGRYNPSLTDGKKLLSHELTHVVQQGNHSPDLQMQPVPTPACPSNCHNTAAQAVVDVPAHVVPQKCFVWEVGIKECPKGCGRWKSMPGTGCAHWVAHQLNITNGLHCNAGMSVRVKDVVSGKTPNALTQAQVGDIWTNDGLSHTGIVKQIETNNAVPPVITKVRVEHDSSAQRGVVNDWFTSGHFYRNVVSP